MKKRKEILLRIADIEHERQCLLHAYIESKYEDEKDIISQTVMETAFRIKDLKWVLNNENQ